MLALKISVYSVVFFLGIFVFGFLRAIQAHPQPQRPGRLSETLEQTAQRTGLIEQGILE